MSHKPEVISFFDEPTNTVTYILSDPETKSCAIIDSVLDYDASSGRTKTTSADEVIDFIKTGGLTVQWILETHAHADHFSAAPYLQNNIAQEKWLQELTSLRTRVGSLKERALEDASYTAYRRIGVAVDTDSMDNRIDFEMLSRLLENYNAQLHFVHIADKQERVLEKAFIRERFGKLLVLKQWSFTVIEEDKPEEGIDEFLTETPIDLLVLLYREHGFFEALFKKGLRKKMLYASKAPLLIVK